MLEEIKKRLGEGYKVTETTVTKNNGIVLNGYSICKAGEKCGVNIYVNGVPEDEIVDFVINKFNEIDFTETKKFGMELITKEYILSNVYPGLINHDNNKSRLNDLIHRPYLDLEIVYRVKVTDSSTFLITKNILDNVDGITEEELYNAAMKNIVDVTELVDMQEQLGIPVGDRAPMLVITTKNHWNGAGAILNKSILEKVRAEFNDDLFLIPSSVEEYIAIPVSFHEARELNRMVVTINNTEVRDEDVLADHVYIYRDGKVEVA